jgi:hypothetical protein
VVKVLSGHANAAGRHSIKWDASDEASGIYFYRLEAGTEVASKKMLLLK